MGKIFTRPLTDDQKQKIAAKSKPSAEDILRAQDDLFMNLLLRVNELESQNRKQYLGGDSYD